MTAPFAPPPPREVWWVLGGLAAFAAVMPFGRGDGWRGWVSFLVICAVAVGLWGLLIVGAVRRFRAWRRERRRGG